MGSYYFQQVLSTGLAGADNHGVTNYVVSVAEVILLFTMLWEMFCCWIDRGDVRRLGTAGIKYLALGLVFVNYSVVFRDVLTCFNTVSNTIYNMLGVGDLVTAWMNALSGMWANNPSFFQSLWNLITGGIAALTAAIYTLAGYIILPIAYQIFTFIYLVYGSILYLVGPFILALIPSRAIGQTGWMYFKNMMIFAMWGVLYGIMQVSMIALQIDSPQQILNQNSFLGGFVAMSAAELCSIASVILAFMILLIPFIAYWLVNGMVGQAAMMTVGTVITVVRSLARGGGDGH